MFLSTSINIWLLVITILTLRLIRSNLNEIFKSEMWRINFIYWSFIVSYTSWMFFDMLQMITPNNDGENFYESCIIFILMPIVWDYIPILIVLFIHFKNVVSVNRLLKLTQVNKDMMVYSLSSSEDPHESYTRR